MGQEEVYNVLAQMRGNWLTTRQVHEELVNRGVVLSPGTVTVNMSKLYKKKDVERVNTKDNMYAYRVNDE